jgi:hypothetical protein
MGKVEDEAVDQKAQMGKVEAVDQKVETRVKDIQDVSVPPNKTETMLNTEPDKDLKIEKTQEVSDSSVDDSLTVDTEKVEFTDGVKFMWKNQIIEFKRGDKVKVSLELRDILLARGCITLRPS